jgi:hypothetical protein
MLRRLTALVLVSCTCTAEPPDGVQRVPEVTPVPLIARPGRVLDQCRRTPFVGPACPGLLIETDGPYKTQAIGLPDSPSWTLDVQAGAPYPGVDRRNAPPRFAHIAIEAGDVRFEFSMLEATSKTDLVDKQRTEGLVISRPTWGGRTGLVLLAPPYPLGGIHGDHLMFSWTAEGTDFIVSLHAWRPLDEATATLRRIVESIPDHL